MTTKELADEIVTMLDQNGDYSERSKRIKAILDKYRAPISGCIFFESSEHQVVIGGFADGDHP